MWCHCRSCFSQSNIWLGCPRLSGCVWIPKSMNGGTFLTHCCILLIVFKSTHHCAVNRTRAPNQRDISMSVCGRHASSVSIWSMWCYRSTKDRCCPIQARISRLWGGLWCIQERPERPASAPCWLLHCLGPVWRSRLCARHLGLCLPSPHARLRTTGWRHGGASSAWTHWNVCVRSSWRIYRHSDMCSVIFQT